MGPYVPSARPDAPTVEIVYRRPPDRIRSYRQELLRSEPDHRVTLLIRPPDAEELRVTEGIVLEGGASLLWFTFPGRWHEVGAFHDREGRLLGWYTNVIRPPRLMDARWEIHDLFLDVWQEPGGAPRVLDEDELREALERGWIDGSEAARAREECARVADRARARRWPPATVRRTPLEAVPYLRLRRDAPGTYRASLTSGRVIGYGLYMLGAVSATSVGFAALTDAFQRSGPSEVVWLMTIAAEAALLLPLALAGRLPATRWPRPAPTDERTLFLAAVAAGLAVLVLPGRAELRLPLAAVYGVLMVFLGIFAVCRAWYDRTFPGVAAAGLLVSTVALLILL